MEYLVTVETAEGRQSFVVESRYSLRQACKTMIMLGLRYDGVHAVVNDVMAVRFTDGLVWSQLRHRELYENPNQRTC